MPRAVSIPPKERDPELMAYCGLYCGACFARIGEIADMARDLRKAMRDENMAQLTPGLAEYMKEFGNFDECYSCLGAFVKMRCNTTCREGGGPPFCRIRKCCQRKGINGCWECDEYDGKTYDDCKKLDFLRPMRGDAHILNIKKCRRVGVKKFLEGKVNKTSPK